MGKILPDTIQDEISTNNLIDEKIEPCFQLKP